MYNVNRKVSSLASIDYSNFKYSFTRGYKFFELSNHLGNVLVTVSDKKIQLADATGTTLVAYEADVITANDYYPFGSAMPGRRFTSPPVGGAGGGYRYGFNGKENDKDADEGIQDYGMRIYDARLGRFLSVDKMVNIQPHVSPYNFAGDKPIAFIDFNGNIEIMVSVYNKNADGTLTIVVDIPYHVDILDETEGVTRDQYKITVIRTVTETWKKINPSTIETSFKYNVLSIKTDEKTGLDKEEQYKRDHPFDYYTNKTMLFIANLGGVVDIAKGIEDGDGVPNREFNGKVITPQKASNYRKSGIIKGSTLIFSAAVGKFASFVIFEGIDLVAEYGIERLAKMGIGNDKIMALIYHTLKFGIQQFKNLKNAKELIAIKAIDFALALADLGVKGEALILELEKNGVLLNTEVAKDKRHALEIALKNLSSELQGKSGTQDLKTLIDK